MAKIEGYSSATSVLPGQELGFHLNSQPAADLKISIYRISTSDQLLTTDSIFGSLQEIPLDVSATGCNWQTTFKLKVPEDWQSGLYRAEFVHPEIANEPAKIYFTIKSLQHGTRSPILFQLAVTTAQAYNPWPQEYPGKSLYQSDSPTRCRRVSFDRPHPGFDYYREVPFVRWLEQNNFLAEYCTSIDLHAEPDFLKGYQLLLSVGHDEYWSREMRDQVEKFIEDGGNVAFFTGNTCWWQIRFEDNNRTMVCYKSAVEDPLIGKDNSRVTVEWHGSPVNRPENSLTGVSFRKGAGIWNPCASSQGDKGYQVRFADHWVFQGIGLKNGDLFGKAEQIMGYEADAADYVEIDGCPVITGYDGTPPTFVILATCDLKDWRSCGKGGYATMGIFRRTGMVFNASTTDWYRGLTSVDNPVSKITYNVINCLKHRYPTDNWEMIGQAKGIAAIAGTGYKLFLADNENMTLWSREPVGQNIPLKPVGRVDNIIAMAGGDDNNFGHNARLFAATKDGSLLCKEGPSEPNTEWQRIGGVPQILTLAAMNGKLFATTKEGLLLSRGQADNWSEDWQKIGHAENVIAMTGLNGALFAVKEDGSLIWWNLMFDNVSWKKIGETDNILLIAALSGKLFAVTREQTLVWRDAIIQTHCETVD